MFQDIKSCKGKEMERIESNLQNFLHGSVTKPDDKWGLAWSIRDERVDPGV